MDVQAYLQRMNYSGSLEPNLENLRALALAHKMNVPFSNLDFFGGEKSSLVLEEIYQKVVVKGQTGICCELSGLFMWLLDQLGYATSATNARYYYEEQQAWMEGCNHLMPFVRIFILCANIMSSLLNVDARDRHSISHSKLFHQRFR